MTQYTSSSPLVFAPLLPSISSFLVAVVVSSCGVSKPASRQDTLSSADDANASTQPSPQPANAPQGNGSNSADGLMLAANSIEFSLGSGLKATDLDPQSYCSQNFKAGQVGLFRKTVVAYGVPSHSIHVCVQGVLGKSPLILQENELNSAALKSIVIKDANGSIVGSGVAFAYRNRIAPDKSNLSFHFVVTSSLGDFTKQKTESRCAEAPDFFETCFDASTFENGYELKIAANQKFFSGKLDKVTSAPYIPQSPTAADGAVLNKQYVTKAVTVVTKPSLLSLNPNLCQDSNYGALEILSAKDGYYYCDAGWTLQKNWDSMVGPSSAGFATHLGYFFQRLSLDGKHHHVNVLYSSKENRLIIESKLDGAGDYYQRVSPSSSTWENLQSTGSGVGSIVIQVRKSAAVPEVRIGINKGASVDYVAMPLLAVP
jgi:hypothetical protein